jgi:hypothetical protein
MQKGVAFRTYSVRGMFANNMFFIRLKNVKST